MFFSRKREQQDEPLTRSEAAMLRRHEHRLRVRAGGTSPRVLKIMSERGLREKPMKENSKQ